MTAERIGVFGGTFDPPHLGHVRVADAALVQFKLSRVLWIPAAASPHKSGFTYSDVTHRMEMTRLCTARNPGFEVSGMEADRGGISFTLDTLELLREQYTLAKFFLILGADAASAFGSWKEPGRIVDLADLIIYPREDFDASRVSVAAHWLKTKQIRVSSSDIRSRIAQGKPVRRLVPEVVRMYITDHRLYRNP